MASISAHETNPLHALSTELLIESITSNPLAEFTFGKADFSPAVPSSSTDASQPYNKRRIDRVQLYLVFQTYVLELKWLN